MSVEDSTSFAPVNAAVVDELRAIVGAKNVATDKDALLTHGADETEDLVFVLEVVVQPTTTEQVSAIMKLATKRHIAVTPRGAGTGLSGGALPVHGGIVLAMKRFDRILEIDRDNSLIVVEPGVITEVLQDAVEEVGLFYPPDPASRGSCFIGGNLAECAGGPRAVKYGVTKDYVLGLEAVLPNGDIINHGGKLLKNVSGYNLTQLIVGSEGTLAVITKIILKLIPKPPHNVLMLVPFDTLESCAAAVPAIMNRGIVPSTLELMEREAIEFTAQHLGVKVQNIDAAAQLLIGLDGTDEGVIEREAERVCEIVMELGATDVLLANTDAKRNELWTMRRAIGEAVRSVSVYKEEDTVVPRAAIVPLLKGVKEIAKRHDIKTVCYGHAGDGNLHVNILKLDMPDDQWNDKLDPVIREIFELTVSLGGQISGEHGIGYVQKEYLPIALSETELTLMRAIKHTFDPTGILNPGKLLPSQA